MMKPIYLVSTGNYSDYTVIAAFTTIDKAKAFMAATKTDWSEPFNEVEEISLDSNIASLVKRGYACYTVVMLRDGEVEYINRRDINADHITSDFRIWRRPDKPDCLDARVIAKTEEQAIKIANDKRAEMIAMGEWGGGE